MKGIMSRGMVAKLLSLSLSLVYLAAQPAQAQTSRSSSTKSAPAISVTPTAVPSATAESKLDSQISERLNRLRQLDSEIKLTEARLNQIISENERSKIEEELKANPINYNSCLPPYELYSGGVPFTGVCEREYVDGKYVCRHFARDFCEAILDNGSNQAMGSGCWVVGVNMDKLNKASDWNKRLECLADKCGLGAWIKQIGNPIRRASKEMTCPKHISDCIKNKFYGHAVNIVRTGGQEFLDRYGEVTFMLVEPQHDGGSAVLCSWTQKKLEPEILSECKEAVASAVFPEQVSCGAKHNFKVWALDEYTAEVARMDKVEGDETPSPNTTPSK